MLSNSLILIFSVVALFATLLARLDLKSRVSAPLFVASFLCVAFCVTYAFLLGVDIQEILTYILAFALISATVFHNMHDGALVETGVRL